MVIHRASPDTDQEARSLLQKAIRRSDAEIAYATFSYLVQEKNDIRWLKNRYPVMVFEEAWHLGRYAIPASDLNELRDQYISLALNIKDKSAAGLGSLAYAYFSGQESALLGSKENQPIKIVSEAIRRRDDFFNWLKGKEMGAHPVMQEDFIDFCLAGSKKAGWPWDKAFAYAAAFLAARDGVFENTYNGPRENVRKFPYWVAIDKHTPRGRSTIKAIARNENIDGKIASWSSFYFESAFCSYTNPSDWWEKEKQWRFSNLNTSTGEAGKLWAQIRDQVREALNESAADLRVRIEPYFPQSLDAENSSKTDFSSQGILF